MLKIKQTKSVDQILSVFNKTIEELEKVSSSNSQIVLDNEDKIQELKDENRVAMAEFDKAQSVITKIKQLIS